MDPKEVSPIFTQFLECVWQLTEQFPQAFEFSEWFLLQIHEHVHSCQYGNFLGNNQRQREELQLRERTHSLWAFLMSEKQNYLNPFYSPAYSEAQPVLTPSTLPYNFKFWRNMYHQFDRSMHPRQSILKTILTLRENSRKTESTLQTLESRLHQLGVTPITTSAPPAPPPTRDQRCNTLPPRPDSLILGAPMNHKEVQQQEDDEEQEEVGEEATESTDMERTVEGSSGTESRKQSYGELEGTYNSESAKEEPAVVSLEFGVARMTC